jgi:quercetin dioxygenase-like cupin family protein
VEYAIQGHETAGARRLFDGDTGCRVFTQRLLELAPGDSHAFSDPDSDEVIYVLEGQAVATLLGATHDLKPGVAAFVSAGTPWSAAAGERCVVLSVLVHEPAPATGTHALLDLAEREAGGATAGRQFRLLATPEVGCASVTQFVGYIPVGRAPDHFHKYDEVVYVLSGQGTLHIAGESASLRPGTAVHLPATLVHSLENTGPGEMQVLGVFRPAGSPAEAYYPDGTLAVVPTGKED